MANDTPQKKLSFEAIQDAIEYVMEKMYMGEDDEFTEALAPSQSEELNALLDELFEARKEKADGIAQYILIEKGNIEKLRKESQRLASRARSKENTLNFLTSGWLARMEQSGVKKVEGNTYTLSRRCTKVCKVVDEAIIPDEWWNVTETRKPAKTDILNAMKSGTEVPGCTIGESYSLSAKAI